MTNKEIILNLPRLKEFERELKFNNKLISDLEKKNRKLIDIIDTLSSVTEVYEGIPLQFRADCIYTMDHKRWACYYQNANNIKLWGGHIYRKGKSKYREEAFLGSDWKSKAEIVEACKQYCAFGVSPIKNPRWL